MTRAFALLLLVLGACDACGTERGHGHAHEDEHSHAHGAHGGHDHSDDHPEGHDHHEEGHGHSEPVVRGTYWSTDHEVFSEHTAVTAGERIELLVHVTTLSDFSPVAEGALTLSLRGPTTLTASAPGPTRPGIYEISLEGGPPGAYYGEYQIGERRVGGVVVDVFGTEQAALAAAVEPDHDELIELLKEQQWGIPFATAFPERRLIGGAIEVPGAVETPPGGTAEVSSTIAGRLLPPAAGLRPPGAAVRRGELLATIAPAPASPEDSARATLAVAEAEARVARARSDVSRAERLLRDQAIAPRELDDARREVTVAEETLRAAQETRALFAGASAGTTRGGWRLLAPIDGVLVDVRAMPGAVVAPGDVLFRIVDSRRLWVSARVPEDDAARFARDRAAAVRITGLDVWFPLEVSGVAPTASIVSVSPVVDPRTRTVRVIYELSAPDPRLRVGALVTVEVPVDAPAEALVLPRSAIVDEGGRSVVYVQVDGEHFRETNVRLGPTQSGHVALTSGLQTRDRVVTRGAHVVRLASRAGTAIPHGHIH